MKQKSLRRRGLTFLKIHTFLFVLFTLGMSANIFLTLNHPDNWDVRPAIFNTLVMQSLSITFMWSIVLLVHMAFHQIRALREHRARVSHAQQVEAIQERYEAGAHLDVDAQGAEYMLDEEVLYAEHYNEETMRSR